MWSYNKAVVSLQLRALEVLFGLSLLGLAVSLWIHLEAIGGVDPGFRVRGFWVFELVLFALIMPVTVELFSRKPRRPILRSPCWMRRALFALLVYYGLNFYIFLYWSVDHLQSSATWRMVSSGWLLLFGLTAVFYWVRFAEGRNNRL